MRLAFDFIEEPFTVEIKDGNAILTWPDGAKRSVPLRVFRMEHARAGKILAEHDARKAEVVPIRRKGK